MTGPAAEGLTLKAALLLGFGLTLGLWVFTGYDIASRVTAMQEEATQVTTRYMRAQDLLSSMRAQVLLGSVYVRDALLDPDPETIEGYRRRLTDVYSDIDRALAQYVPVLDSPTERQRLDDLRHELEAFRATILDVLATDRTRWPTEARLLLNQRVMPRREALIRLSEDVQALNRRTYIEQQNHVASVYAAAQRATWQRLGLALAASLGIVLMATLYATRLERRLHEQRARDLQNTRELQRLSAKLITAQEEERRAIARELHDEIGQVLTAMKVELAHARRQLEAHGTGAGTLNAAQAIADSALHSVRDLSRLLHPSVLDDLGLPAALESYIHGFRQRHGFRVDFDAEGMEERLPSSVEAAAYRIVQEALTNVVKHAAASACRVSLRHHEDTLVITVEDNGRGFANVSDRRTEPRGLGLIGVRERAAHLNGRVTFDRSAEGGARVRVELPAAVVPQLHPAEV
jgi:signal transduction histidine kinase